MTLTSEQVEKEITNVINEVNERLKISETVNADDCPGNIPGLTSQILVTVIGRIANNLGVTIPNDCYIFHDKDLGQLTVKQAAQKLLDKATNGK